MYIFFKGLLLILFAASLPLSAAKAVSVDDLYQAQVLVSDQSNETRAAAIDRALDQVLIKLSGNSDMLAQLKRQPFSASSLLQYYTYQEFNSKKQPWWLDSGVTGDYLVLEVGFDRQAVNQALREREAELWGANRPATLIWLALESDGERHIIGTRDETADIVEQHAQRRGLPLLVPVMDLEDTAQVNVSDIWGQFSQVIQTASRRYGANAILTAAIYAGHQGVWHARWTLYQGRQSQNWENSGNDLSQVIAAGIDHTADQLATRYFAAKQDLTSQNIILAVSPVRDAKDYVAVTDYLSRVGPLEWVELMQVTPDTLRFAVKLQGDDEILNQALSLDHMLIPEATSDADEWFADSVSADDDTESEQTVTLNYRWSP